MLKPVIDYFKSIAPLSEELINEIMKYAEIKEFKKGEYILTSGKISNHTYWILKGLIRSYYLREDEEITTKFLWEGAPVTSVYSYFGRRPGNENIVAVEDTTLASIHYDHMQFLYKTYPAFNTIGRIVTERTLYMWEIEVYNLRKQKAEDRYKFIVKHFPQLLQRVPLKHLASYLGINLETLSRIRAKKNRSLN